MILAGKVALVTGGLSGIGAAVAARFAAEGALVVAGDLTATQERLGDGAIAPLRLDVADPESCAAAVAAIVDWHGGLDVMVNCAGIARDMPFLDTPVEVFDRIIAVNLRGSFLIGQASARVMSAGGAIVNIASVSGMRGNTGRSAYGASKGGVVTLSQVMAVDLAERGIRVNVIAPGPVETPLVAAVHDAEVRGVWNRAVPLHRYATPEEIAGAALYLCGPDAGYVTGHVLAVDGGFLAAGIQRG
ncbi:MAG: short-chain dehydrogenase [Rhodospirillales bacterium 70-18]|nr:SDR family oxidoreductase [Rhodospirillales bacterium]OJY67329.1 MAG: short-chain dehydrogenase [Rhodospirillales bacterium 70-18]